MKKMLILMLCIGLIPVLHANSDIAPQALPDSKAPYRTDFVMPEMPPTDQDTLWAQYPPTATALGLACQHDGAYPFDAWVVDDVTPAADGNYNVEEVVSWWANWNGFTSWTYVSEVYFQVYEDSGLAYPFPKIMPSQEVTVLPANFTATTIGTDQYLLEMTLPSTVTLPAGEISWVCVQPSNEFTVNGQTGWMSEVGIGNGQELYFAFPLLGTDKWATATSQWGFAYEAGFVLLGTEGGGGAEITWDFEDGTWQDWTHTNGMAYPAGWDIIGAGTVNWPPPDMGNYLIALDDDAAGSGTSVIDTAISPVFTEFAGDWLYWGVGYNNIGSDWLDVIIAYGGTYDLVAHYTTDQGGYYYGVWDSTDVSGYGSGSYQIMLVYNDGGTWAWWAEVDNIGPVIMGGGVDQHDVGSLAFLSPGTQVSPADYDVIGVVKNYGDFDETYDVHCVVTDPTLAVVLDETVNVTTPIGENDTINFGTLTFVDGYTYDLMMATLLSGDENPANDTLEQSTFVTSWFWESWTAIDQGRSGPYAGFWNIDGQSYVYYWGGNPGPLATGFKYDGSGWTAVASMGIGSSYGGDMSFDGKVYLISAWTGQNGMLSIFDCESETFSSGTNLPTPVADPACALYMDNYIYCIGGSNPPGWAGSTIVQVYDIGSDTWLTGVTQLPSSGLVSTAEAGYIGNDTLIVAGGYDTGATNKTTMGAINPANPAEVTWSTGTPHPGAAAYRNFGGAYHNDDMEYWFMVAGGSPYTAQAAIYQSNAGWITAPDKITACSNSGAVTGPWETLVADDAEILLYTIAGYTGSYLNIFEVFHTGVWTGIEERPNDNVTVFDFSAKTTNPVKDQVRFTLSMPYQGEVSFQVFDVTGRQVIDTRYSSISQGEHTLFWNLKDEQNRKVAAGTYFFRFQTGEHTATGKLVVVR